VFLHLLEFSEFDQHADFPGLVPTMWTDWSWINSKKSTRKGQVLGRVLYIPWIHSVSRKCQRKVASWGVLGLGRRREMVGDESGRQGGYLLPTPVKDLSDGSSLQWLRSMANIKLMTYCVLRTTVKCRF
jgi:hypothetical protein